jgi:hypothetical protein
MVKAVDIPVENEALTDSFRGYSALLRQIKQRLQFAQQRAVYAANEELLRMYWILEECCSVANRLMDGGRKLYSDCLSI